MLVARDEQSCLVVSYKEIKQCIESAFRFVVHLLLFCVSHIAIVVSLQVHEGHEIMMIK